ncbi:MAG: OmpH family outer membrane protein [Alphaproteobacteria bacterium]|nr:OmpH family outer membrane protein [Alphaproteobacteria bacterium]
MVKTKAKTNTKSAPAKTSSSQSNSNCSWKIAVVDIMSIVNGSQDVATLRQNHAVRSQELSQWLQLAQNEVNNQTDQQAKQSLFQKYNAEFAQRRNAVNQMYQQELASVDQSITKIIMDEAKKLGYNMVLTKNVVVCGGDDITEEVRKLIK